MKRFLAVLLALTLIFTVGCDRGGDNPPENTDSTVQTDEEGNPIEPKEPINHKVGYIYKGSVNNSAHNSMFENSRIQLEKNQIVETCFIDNVFVQNFDEAVELLIEQGVTVIVSTSHGFANAVEFTAQENKDINFISFGGIKTLGNLSVFKPLLYQPANVCGLAASYNTTKDSVGIVADPSMYNVSGVVNSYIEGVKMHIDKGLETHINYVRSVDEAEIKAAIDALVAKGNDMIMVYLATDYGIKYCEQIGVKVVGYANNMHELAPNNFITGFHFNVNSYISEQVRFMQNDIFIPNTVIGEMRTGHVNLLALNKDVDLVHPDTKRLTDKAFEGIVAYDRVFEGTLVDNFGVIQVEHGITLDYKDVLEMKWLDYSTRTRVDKETFLKPVDEVALVPLVVKER